MDADLLEFADTLYNRLDVAVELAPISDYLATDWLMETELMQKKRMPLPVALPGEKMPTNVERFLEASKGEPLLYFDSYEAVSYTHLDVYKRQRYIWPPVGSMSKASCPAMSWWT